MIKSFIKKNNLKPVSSDPVFSSEMRAEKLTAATSTLIPWWYRGGKKFAHLHYQGDVYLLNEEQWKDFSTSIIADMSKKLAASKNVSFTGILDLSDSISEMNSFI